MRGRNRRSFGIIAGLLTLVLGFPAGAEGFVLCVSADGHVAIEAASTMCCESEVPTNQIGQPMDADCGPCVDLPFLTAASESASHRLPVPARTEITILRSAYEGLFPLSRFEHSQHLPRVPELSNPSLQSLSSVVLLT